jgi:hypothetical protein
MAEVLKESGLFFIAFIVGAFSFKRLNVFYRMVFLQIIVFALVYWLGYLITQFQDENNLPKNNTWIYNLYFPIECALLAYAGSLYFKSKKLTYIITISYCIVLISFAWQVSIQGIHLLANYAVALEALLLVGLYLFILYHKFGDANFTSLRSSEFWLSIGIVLYFSCIVPYFGMMNYLNEVNPELSLTFFTVINEGLSNIRYLFTAVAFWVFYRQQKLSMKQVK